MLFPEAPLFLLEDTGGIFLPSPVGLGKWVGWP